MSNRRRLLVGTAAVLTVLVMLLMSYRSIGAGVVLDWVREAFDFLRGHPVVLFCAIVVLPGVGFPMTPFYLVAGPAFASSFGLAASCGIILCASTLNMTWTYFVASGVLHKLVEGILARLHYRLPRVQDRDHVQLILIMRVTPGIPLVVQNYLLGLARVRFAAYLPISVVVQSGYLVGFVVTAGAIYKGSTGLVIGGVCALVAVVLAMNLVRKRLAVKV